LVAVALIAAHGGSGAAAPSVVTVRKLDGEVVVKRPGGQAITIGYLGKLSVSRHKGEVLVDLIGTGVLTETREQVGLRLRQTGQVVTEQRLADAGTSPDELLHVQLRGPLRVKRERGPDTVYDLIDAGSIARESNEMRVELAGSGVVRANTESVVVDLSGVGVISE
jgi:hypothetical protein